MGTEISLIISIINIIIIINVILEQVFGCWGLQSKWARCTFIQKETKIQKYYKKLKEKNLEHRNGNENPIVTFQWFFLKLLLLLI